MKIKIKQDPPGSYASMQEAVDYLKLSPLEVNEAEGYIVVEAKDDDLDDENEALSHECLVAERA